MVESFSSLIFSKDRGMQLDALLQSLDKNAKNIFSKVSVYYTVSNLEYQKAYDILIDSYPEIHFIKQQDFEEEVRGLINQPSNYYVGFVDDEILFQPIVIEPIVAALSQEDVSCFSFRLGLNTSYCYTLASPNALSKYKEHDGYISWDWTEETLEFAGPLCVNSHVFNSSLLQKLIIDLSFKDPNYLEMNLQSKRFVPVIPNKMASYTSSVIVSNAINVVGSVNSRRSYQHYHSTEELNSSFLTGMRIDIDQMDFSNIISPHQEIAYKFKVL